MLDPTIQQIIGAIHASQHQLVLEFAGAASMGLFWLHAVPGSSRTILEATDRYAADSLAELLGEPPEKFVAASTAEAMAQAAYRRARRLAQPGVACLGVGCTAALVTDRARKGDDRCWIAVRASDSMATYGLVITKGLRDRLGEEEVVSRLLIHAIAEACGVQQPTPLGLQGSEQVQANRAPADDPIGRLLAGEVRTVSVLADGALIAEHPVVGAILSGSFNPLHAGHERLAQAAAAALGLPVTFEIPVQIVDKAPLSYAEIERRLAQFRWRHPVALSRERLFVDKATLYPGCVFIIGYDTAERLIELRFYQNDPQARDAAFAHIRAHGCRFLVAGRLDDGVFRTLRDLELPAGARELMIELPEALFRVDVSSTSIRQQLAGAAPAAESKE